MNQRQNVIIDRYQNRLDKANQEICIDYEKQLNIWLPLYFKATELAEQFIKLRKTLYEEI